MLGWASVRQYSLAMKADAQTEAAMVGMLDSFCSAFQARDVEAVMRLFAPDPDVVVRLSARGASARSN